MDNTANVRCNLKIATTDAKRAAYLCAQLLGGLSVMCTVLMALYGRGRIPEWYGLYWYEHSDHWHIFNIAKNVLEGGIVRSLQSDVYSRLPSIFPDAVVALFLLLTPLKGIWLQVGFSAVSGVFIFLVGQQCLLAVYSEEDLKKKAISIILLWAAVVCLAIASLRGLAETFVPIHHGGNALLTLVALYIVLTGKEHRGRASYWQALGLLLVSLAGVCSNRFFLISWTFSYALVSIGSLHRRHVLLNLGTSIAGSLLGLLIFSLMKTQGREQVSLDLSIKQVVGSMLQSSSVYVLVIIVVATVWLGLSKRFSKKQVFSVGKVRWIMSYAMTCSALSIIASIIISGGLIEDRYMLASCWTSLIGIASFVLLPMTSRMHRPSMAILNWCMVCILSIPVGWLIHERERIVGVPRKSIDVRSILEKEGLEKSYGLAVYPEWHASAIYWLSKEKFPILEASSDSNPLFWHRWKGAYLTLIGRQRFENGPIGLNEIVNMRYILTDAKNERVLERYGRPDKEFCFDSDSSRCLWIYADGQELRRNAAIFINTYGNKVKS